MISLCPADLIEASCLLRSNVLSHQFGPIPISTTTDRICLYKSAFCNPVAYVTFVSVTVLFK